ncbi:factor-independent urate hydroxylase [Mariniblastus fucicola]|uniref:Uricase n=1 Tax=Mariniblastus fucicola TaxID=980251 RepID=A0A5B9P2L8_9BACT|nr:urate oxidase [Mariniblastus fucicola]QEG20767.1 Uricase [Mariniblastus fucicola]
MSIKITEQSYGKARVCLSYIKRNENRHDFVQLTANVALAGDFNVAYSAGDNSPVIPTDTMKNTVYAIARKQGVDSIEAFARNLASHFYDSFEHVSTATISIEESLWNRIEIDSNKHDHAFVGGGSEQNTCTATASAEGVQLSSGLKGLQVLKTTQSGFEGFLQDDFTTLKPTDDRIFATTITADWTCQKPEGDWSKTRTKIRQMLLDVFATQYSPSVQKTLYEMADAVLAACPEIGQISLNMPNQHHLLADIEKLSLQNENDIFVPTPEPFGVISATISREV